MHTILTKHWLLTFTIMLGVSLVFGLCSYNIFFLVQTNVTLVLDYGVMALLDGAFVELLLLTFYGVISLGSFLVFEACKDVLVKKMLKK